MSIPRLLALASLLLLLACVRGPDELRLAQRLSSHGASVEKLQHFRGGLEVIGSFLNFHDGRSGSHVQDRVARFDLDLSPDLAPGEAIAIAGREPLAAPELKILPSADRTAAALVYVVPSPGEDTYVDAHSGRVAFRNPTELAINSVQVYSAAHRGANIVPNADGSCEGLDLGNGELVHFTADECKLLFEEIHRPPGPLCQVMLRNSPIAFEPSLCTRMIADGQPTAAADNTGKRAAQNAQVVLKYYKEKHGRAGLDAQGSDIVSIVHAGAALNNAFYRPDLRIMVYGDGDGRKFVEFSRALDVAGHEMTHGVTSFTARLFAIGVSGALNEATSDFFGKAIEGKGDWLIGRDATVDGKGIRDLAQPSTFSVQGVPYPENVRDAFHAPIGDPCNATNDQCWVHVNSTIFSHALYLMSRDLSMSTVEKFYYVALTHYLGPGDDFQSAADSTINACKDVFDQATCETAAQGLSAVGLTPYQSNGGLGGPRNVGGGSSPVSTSSQIWVPPIVDADSPDLHAGDRSVQ